MGKVGQKHVEGRTREERIKVRKKLGKLSTLTVQQSTRKRYDSALSQFTKFLVSKDLTLPSRKDHLDHLVSDYVEHLWENGFGRALASDTLADPGPAAISQRPFTAKLAPPSHVGSE